MKHIFTIGLLFSAFLMIAVVMEIKAYNLEEQQKTVEQQYIVRYGTTYDHGSTIVTEDGNEWTLIDAPEYENGTEVRVLFDSNRTQNITDDIIIDVTEK
jgi:hypothetical protein